MAKRYAVTLTFRFPSWDERNGYRYEVSASSKADATRYARRMAERDGHLGGHAAAKGRATLKAQEI